MAPINAQRLTGRTTKVQSASVVPQQQLIASPVDNALLKDISKSLTNIIQLLSQQNLQSRRDFNQTLRTEEQNRRQGIELGLEKPFAVVKNAAQAVVAPVKGILDQIIQFFLTLFVGRALILLLDWFADEKNRNKIRSIMRFLSDWWPSLVAGYILFGTGFGRVVRKVASIAVSATARLLVIAARLTKAIATGKGLKGAAAAFSGGGKLGGLRGFALRGGLAVAATVGTGLAVNKFMGGGGEQETPQLDVPEVPAVPALGAFGGGFANIKDLFSSATSNVDSNIFAPFTALFGSGGLASVMQGLGGVVSGPKGIDKVPAMLTDGEFVMSRGAVQKFGVSTLESMNAAGGGTNIPRIIHGIPHAAGGGYIGGNEERRKQYDAKHGEGAYEKESARRRAVANATPERYDLPPLKTGNQEYLKQIKANAKKLTPQTPKTPQTPYAPTTPQINIKAPVIAQYTNPKREAEAQARKKARAEYTNIITNINHPDYDKAWNDPKFLESLRAKHRTQTETPASKAPKMGTGYTPYVSRFAGARDVAHERASKITGSRPYVNPFSPGGMFGGSRMQARTDYAASKGKYYSSSDQKTYGNYNDAFAAKKSRMTSLASQQRLDKLSFAGANRSSRGVRIDAEDKARGEEFKKRGGLMGQLGRLGQRMFGGGDAQRRLDMQQKASDARTKQAGAASIGRYYSSSDGKYYANFAAADKARIARQKPKGKTITPTPKPAPKVVSTKPKVAGGGMGGKRGSGANPSVPKIPSSSGSNRKNANIYGIK